MFDGKPADYVLHFGAHKGKALNEIPLTYLDWVIGQGWLDRGTKEVVEEYLSDPVVKAELEKELAE